jgi:Flp pilus assembly protein TadG
MGRNLSVPRPGRGARGQALTEFALVVPMLLLMIVGIMEFGRAWAMSQVVTDAARQGARMAALLNDSSAGQDSVRRVVIRALQAGNINATNQMVAIDNGWKAGTNTPVGVTVSVPYDFGVFRPVMQLAAQSFNDGTITLRSRAVMRNE